MIPNQPQPSESDTPRTNETELNLIWNKPGIDEKRVMVAFDFARQLERETKDLARKLGECWFERDKLQLRAEQAERSASGWEEDAKRFCRNEFYFRGLIEQIAKHYGVAAMTSDDGSIQQDVICLKVPELVEKERDTLQSKLIAAQESHTCDHVGVTAYSVALFNREDFGYTDGVREINDIKAKLTIAEQANKAANGLIGSQAEESDKINGNLKLQLNAAEQKLEEMREALELLLPPCLNNNIPGDSELQKAKQALSTAPSTDWIRKSEVGRIVGALTNALQGFLGDGQIEEEIKQAREALNLARELGLEN